jgi:hypothetical protein
MVKEIRYDHKLKMDTQRTPVTIKDMEAFLAAAREAGAKDETRMTFSEYKGDQRDPGYSTITIDITRGQLTE